MATILEHFSSALDYFPSFLQSNQLPSPAIVTPLSTHELIEQDATDPAYSDPHYRLADSIEHLCQFGETCTLAQSNAIAEVIKEDAYRLIESTLTSQEIEKQDTYLLPKKQYELGLRGVTLLMQAYDITVDPTILDATKQAIETLPPKFRAVMNEACDFAEESNSSLFGAYYDLTAHMDDMIDETPASDTIAPIK